MSPERDMKEGQEAGPTVEPAMPRRERDGTGPEPTSPDEPLERTRRSLCSLDVSGAKLGLLDEYVGEPAKVLDVGCGNGLYGVHLASRRCSVLQVDLCDRRDDRARHLPFQVMDALDLRLPEDGFDHVLAFDIMEHLDDDMLFLRGVRRLCRRRLFLSVPNSDDAQLEAIGLTHMHHKDKSHRREYSADRLECLLRDNGFRVLCLRPNFNTMLPYFAQALASRNFFSKLAAELIALQCRLLMRAGLLENRTVGDWYCVAERA